MKILLLIISLVFFYHSVADTEQTSTKEDTQASTKEQQSESKQTTQTNTPDTFDPSEKLSQDVPTAFPVDI